MDFTVYRYLVRRVAIGIGIVHFPETFSGIDVFLPFLERMRKEGAVILLKFDGERGMNDMDNGPYTALVSGKVLKGEFFRTDTDSIEDALAYIVVNYARQCWGFTD